LPHLRHAFEFGLGCTSCHSAEKHKALKITKESCMACHHNPENTQCSRCHKNQAALYAAQNLPLDVKGMKASAKSGKVECTGCHELSQKQTLSNISTACLQCHDKGYDDLPRVWKEETSAAAKKTREHLLSAEEKLKKARKEQREVREAARHLAQAQQAYKFIVAAKGIHNPELAASILEIAQTKAQKVEDLLKD